MVSALSFFPRHSRDSPIAAEKAQEGPPEILIIKMNMFVVGMNLLTHRNNIDVL